MSENSQNSETMREETFRRQQYGRNLFGRRVIYASEGVITPENVAAEVEQAYITHLINRDEIQYLWDYYKGRQPVLYRTREIRDELTRHVVENRANEIVSFKTGYLAGAPIQYVSTVSGNDIAKTVGELNDVMRLIGKHSKDKALIEWAMICGVGYRYVVQNNDPHIPSPFNLYTLDPRNTFVIRANDYTQRVLAAVNYVIKKDQQIVFTVYTEDSCYTLLHGSGNPERVDNVFGLIPIIEYPANSARQGCFEIVLSMLDAINDFDSARVEAVEQFVQSLLVLYNCQVDEGTTASTIRAAGMILLKSTGDSKADVKNLSEQLDQTQNQTLKDDLYQSVLQIVGVPSQSASGTSDSSNNGAVVLKNGWQGAETRAQDFEAMFKLPEQEMLRVVSVICAGLSDLAFVPGDIETKFTRRNYENILSKSQTLTTMLQNDKVHPKCDYEASGLFVDTEEAYLLGMQWFEEQNRRAAETAKAQQEAQQEAQVKQDEPTV